MSIIGPNDYEDTEDFDEFETDDSIEDLVEYEDMLDEFNEILLNNLPWDYGC